jgi:phospholipid/cholesterol/gamma-HCH transport system permease protein
MAGNQAPAPSSGRPPQLRRQEGPRALELHAAGDWCFGTLEDIERLLARLVPAAPSATAVTLDCSGLTRLDFAGAWLLRRAAGSVGTAVETVGCATAHRRMLDLVARWPGEVPERPRSRRGPLGGLRHAIEALGRTSLALIGDVGLVADRTLRGFSHPSRLAFRETLLQIDAAGLRAVPIVVLVAFLMGVVLAYQGALQLALFGAELLTVDLVAIAMWREMSGLLTAIIVAGRSGSAFAATLGGMQLREELDALRVIGVDPVNTLVVPRMAALIVALPLLAVMANVVGLLGAWILGITTLDISTAQFLSRLRASVDLNDLLVGLVKLPVFAVIIAGVGTLRGMEVKHSADELGRKTTRAVVESITAVIIANAVFSVIFAELGI